MITMTIIRKKKVKNKKFKKTQVGIFKNMVENIPDGNSPGRRLTGGNFPGGNFPDTQITICKISFEISIHRSRQINKTNSIWVFPDFNFIFLLQ